MVDSSRVEEVLADRPDLESALETVADVDESSETWTFDDVAIESGAFGQLVSEGVVEKANGEYRLADPVAVRAALGDEVVEDGTESTDVETPDLSLPSVDVRALGLLAGALATVLVVRLFSVQSIFRDGAVVLSGNDPYYYRFWAEQTLAEGGVGVVPFGEVPSGIDTGEPFLVATLAWFSGLAGGTDAAGVVLALYPVAVALLVGVMLYVLAVRVTADRRVALASVVLLAVTPGHAFRTSLGYADHHAFDYLWLTLTALSLALVLTADTDRPYADTGCWLAAVGLGVGVSGQVLAWDNGPLLILPVGAIVALAVLLEVRAGRSPLAVQAPVLGGLALAAALTYGVHAAVDWHSTTVSVTPLLLFAGSSAVVAVGELAARFDRDAAEIAVAELVAGVGLLGALAVLVPDLWAALSEGIDRILRGDNIAETQSLFNDVVGFLLVFGFILVVAMVSLVWATARLLDDDEWVVPVVYGWYFFGLSVFQVRFVGELSAFTALFSGLGLVWLAAWVDVLPAPTPLDGVDRRDWLPGRPDRSTVGALFAIFLLVGGLGVVQSAVKMNQVSIDDDSYETAAYIAAYADERGWSESTAATSGDPTDTESYVFTDWGRNRMYNYFVNGQSQSYGYAQSNYRLFAAVDDPATAADATGNARFVVTEAYPVDSPAIGFRLHNHYGSRYDDVDGLSRYRALYVTESGDRKAFLVVPGATLNGTAAPNATVSLSTDVSIPNDEFTYERQVQADASGNFSVTVPNPGTYELSTTEETWTVEVSESSVMNGTAVDATA